MPLKIKKIKINGLKYQVYTWGSPRRPLLFLIHGWLDTGAAFHFLNQYLEDRYFCVAPDLRGYGRSQHTSSPLGYFFFEYVADLRALLKNFSPRKKVTLIGHSLGGAIASVYSGTYPERIHKLVNIEGFGFQRLDLKSPPVRAREYLEGLEVKRFRHYSNREAFVRRLRKNYPRLPKERADFLSKYLGKPVKGGYKMAADPKHKLIEPYPFPLTAFHSFWQKITCPSLFISAGETEFAKYYPKGEYFKELKRNRRYFPEEHQWLAIPQSGHMIHHERPQELALVIDDFIQS